MLSPERSRYGSTRRAAEGPNPGTRGFQRLTRDEYANSIKHLLGVEVDVARYLPADMLSEGMDNIADSQPLSASLMEGYMRAAGEITYQALGDPKATPTSVMFKATRIGVAIGACARHTVRYSGRHVGHAQLSRRR